MNKILIILSFLFSFTMSAYEDYGSKLPQKSKQKLSPFYTKPEVMRIMDLAIESARKGDLDSAQSMVREALEMHPNYIKALSFMAYIEYHQGDFDSAMHRSVQIMKDEPFNKMANLVAGMVKIKLQEYEEAKRIFKMLIDKYPGEWKAYYQLGAVMRMMGNPKKAIEYYRNCINQKEDAYVCYNELAISLLDDGQVKEAFTMLEEITNKDSHQISTYLNLAEISKRSGLYTDRTIAILKQGVTFNSNSQEVYMALIDLLNRAGRETEAIEYQNKSLNMKGNGLMSNDESKAYALKQAGKLNESAALFRSILKDQPDNIYANYHLAGIYRRQGYIQYCIQYYNKILGKYPNHYDATHGLALCYLKDKNYDEAISYLQKARAMNNKDSSACLNLGLTYEIKGLRSKAVNTLLSCKQLPMTKERRKSLDNKVAQLQAKKKN